MSETKCPRCIELQAELIQFREREFKPDWATHPSQHIREYLDCLKMTQAELAEASGLGEPIVSGILNAYRRITPHIAVRLQKALHLDASVWLGLQVNWDLFVYLKNRKERT